MSNTDKVHSILAKIVARELKGKEVINEEVAAETLEEVYKRLGRTVIYKDPKLTYLSARLKRKFLKTLLAK
jgi:hypothetical protein